MGTKFILTAIAIIAIYFILVFAYKVFIKVDAADEQKVLKSVEKKLEDIIDTDDIEWCFKKLYSIDIKRTKHINKGSGFIHEFSHDLGMQGEGFGNFNLKADPYRLQELVGFIKHGTSDIEVDKQVRIGIYATTLLRIYARYIKMRRKDAEKAWRKFYTDSINKVEETCNKIYNIGTQQFMEQADELIEALDKLSKQ